MASDWSLCQETASGNSSECWTASSIHLAKSIFRYCVRGSGADLSEIRSHLDSGHHVVLEWQSDLIPDPGAVDMCLLGPPCHACCRPDIGSP